MQVRGTKKKSGEVLVSGTLDISVADELRQELLSALQRRPALALDLSGVDACDTAGAQVLCAAQLSAQQASKPFRIVSPSEAVLKTISALGISFEDPAGGCFVSDSSMAGRGNGSVE